MPSSEPVLDIDDAVVRYGNRRVLHGVSLQLRAGQVIGLIGPNGAGKSTLIKAIAGLVPIESGTVRVGGVHVARHPVRARRLMSVATQELAVFPPLTVAENVRGWAALCGIPRPQRHQAVADALAAMQLDELRDRKVVELSGGEQRRTHCAMAIVARPRLLILDEPTSGVDPDTRRAVLEHVRRISATGTAVLYSTHYLQEVEYLDADVLLLSSGRIVAAGTPSELIARYSTATVELTIRDRQADGLAQPRQERRPISDPVTALPMLLKDLTEESGDVVGVAVHQPSLEDVFLRLTQRQRGGSSSVV
ncbi:ABC transporter ATP-binding protein [Micromonospora sp. NPDC049523]|uniref:ABC transporter ATP-binding protein n=1 Tax=Micromonospora sp. NPDC049523 TaxID=3155921 RepID=UPI0034400576